MSKNEVMEVLRSYGIRNVEDFSNMLKSCSDQTEKNACTTEEKVKKVLRELGIPANLRGYHYVKHAILYVYEKPDSINSMMKEVYPAIAEKFESTSARVERAIRHAIETSWKRGNIEEINRIFGFTVDAGRGKPRNSEFIAMIVEYLKS